MSGSGTATSARKPLQGEHGCPGRECDTQVLARGRVGAQVLRLVVSQGEGGCPGRECDAQVLARGRVGAQVLARGRVGAQVLARGSMCTHVHVLARGVWVPRY